MPGTIDQSFVTQFESEVKLAYQQMGSKLRDTVRRKSNVEGVTVRFPKLASGTAQTKGRGGDVPVMNAVQSYADATMSDWYAADYADKLDDLKTNVDERRVLVQTGAAAIGRKVDNVIISAATLNLGPTYLNSTAYAGFGSSSYNNAIKAAILQAYQTLNSSDVPDDGQRFCLVGPHQWNHLLRVTEFASSDYVGRDAYPWMGANSQARMWLNTVFIMHSGLATANSAGSRICIMYHRNAIGLGEAGQQTLIDWDARKAAYLIDNLISAGAVRIEDQGVAAFYAQEGAAT